MAERGDSVFLLGNVQQDLERSAQDLKARSASGSAGFALCDLAEPDSFAPALDAADQALGNFDTVVVTAALFASQEALEAASW
jgi:NAD(P)-dependent dehydrogenase (short-subunit alcohol dehydrogenase family)